MEMCYTEAADRDRRVLVMLRSQVERCLQDIWGVHDLEIDSDGDYPFRHGVAICWVSILDGPQPGVRVFAHAAVGLKESGKLLREVNELSTRSVWARVILLHGVVRVSAELHWAAVDRLPLEHAIRLVGEVADDIGLLIAAVHGGSTPFPAEVAPAGRSSEGEAA